MIFVEHFSQLDQIVVSMTGNEKLELTNEELIFDDEQALGIKLLQLAKDGEFIILKAITKDLKLNSRPDIEFESIISCKQCQNEIISIPEVTRIANLPSSYYKELMECFTCHNQTIETKFDVKGKENQILKSSTFAIFSTLNIVPKSVVLEVRNL